MDKQTLLDSLHHGLIVSCQALKDEPLYSPYIMRCMAQAAYQAGACGIRANSTADIVEIMAHVPLPVIGLIKKTTDRYDVYITPTRAEVDQLAKTGVPIIAMDATSRTRPDQISLETSFPAMKAAYPDILFMADCASLEDGVRAQALGFDLVGTTLCGYTDDTAGNPLPDFALMQALTHTLDIPVAAEGGIWVPEQMAKAFEQGVHCCVVGTAITRPREIARRFVNRLPSKESYAGYTIEKDG